KVTGRLQDDAENPRRSSFQVEIDARAVTTVHPAQEDFMRSEAWLGVEKHPTITVRTSAIVPTDSGFLIRGSRTLHRLPQSIEIPAVFHGVVSDPWGLRAGFPSQFTVDRRDFGITWTRVFDWGVMAGDELTFTLDVELAYPDESLAQKPQA